MIYTVAEIAAGLGGAAAVVVYARRLISLLSGITDIARDWSGEPARPGVPEKPGVMIRLERIESDVTELKYHSQPDHGGSYYDLQMQAMAELKGDINNVRRILESRD